MRPRVKCLVAVVCALSFACMEWAATGCSLTGFQSGNLFFTENAAGAKSLPQAKGRKRRSGRKKRTASQANNSSQTNGTSSEKTVPQQTSPQQASLPTRQGPLSGLTYELPIRKPLAGEEQVRGLLFVIDCDAKGITFVVRTGERLLRLRTPDFNGIKFTTYTPDVSGEVTCGAREPASNVVVTFRPSKDARAKFTGELVAVEFVPKDFELKK